MSIPEPRPGMKGRGLTMLALVVAMAAAFAEPAPAPSDPAAGLAALEDRALADWSERRYAQAIALWRQLIAAQPQRRSYRIGLVRTLVSAGDLAQARKELQAALSSTPATDRSDEYNTLVAEGEILEAEQRDDAAAEVFGAAADVAGRDARSRTRGRSPRDQDLPWRLNTGMVVDHFDNERDLESQLLFDLGFRHSRDLFSYALYERHNRFDSVDHVYLLGFSTRATERLAIRADLGGSPGADFRPRLEGSVRLEWLATPRLRPLFGYRLLNYADGDVSTLTPGLRLLGTPIGDVELQYALTSEIDGEHSHIGGVRFDWVLGPQWQPSLSYFFGEEALPPQVRAEFQRVAAGLTWVASREWQLRLDYAYEDREDAYIGQSVALGAGINF
ncbi:MAG: YaiO family outer membrane beta-barrel protein [Panacagrimonas sp.]